MVILFCIMALLLAFIMLFYLNAVKKYLYFGKDNIHSQRAIEKDLSEIYGEEFYLINKECTVTWLDDKKVYKFTVHYVMTDDAGLQFDAYNNMYGIDRHSGDSCEEDYYNNSTNLGAKRIEKYLTGTIDLSKYRTWDKKAETPLVSDYTIIYDGNNVDEVSKVVANIFLANQQLLKKNIVSCEIKDISGKELFEYSYNSFKEMLDGEGIKKPDRYAVQDFVKKIIG